MKTPTARSRAILAASLFAAASAPVSAQEAAAPSGPMVVFRTGRSIPLAAIAPQGENFVVREAVAGYAAGAAIPAASISHVSGEKPAALSIGTGQFLMGQPRDAIKTLEPLVSSLKSAAKISGSYWVESARVLVLAYAQEKETAKIDPLVKDISDATPTPGTDPVGRLAKALATPVSSGFEARVGALNDQISDSNLVEMSAFASFFKGRLLEEEKKNTEAIQAYLTVGCLYPSGSVLTTSAAELRSATLLAAKDGRRDEAVSLMKSAAIGGEGTAIGENAKKRVDSLGDAADKSAEGSDDAKPADK